MAQVEGMVVVGGGGVVEEDGPHFILRPKLRPAGLRKTIFEVIPSYLSRLANFHSLQSIYQAINHLF